MYRSKLLIALLFVFSFFTMSCEHTSPVGDSLNKQVGNDQGIWVEKLPIACLNNHWQQDWIDRHGGEPEDYPRSRDHEILIEFFRERGAAIFQIEEERAYDATCLSCSCPTGEVIFLNVPEAALPIFEQYDWRISGRNLALKPDRPSFNVTESVTFTLENRSSFRFEASGRDRFSPQQLLIAEGSSFVVQQLEAGNWHSVKLPVAMEGVESFQIEPGDVFEGSWFNSEQLTGEFRLVLQSTFGNTGEVVHTFSESFAIADTLVPFDPTTRALDFGDDYWLDPEHTFLDDPIVHFRISHAGGCKPHDYEVRLNRVENLTAFIFINHDANGDLCEALLTNDLRADLTPLLVRDDFNRLELITPDGDLITLRE